MSIGKTSYPLNYKVKFLFEASVELGYLFIGKACSFANASIRYAVPIEFQRNSVVSVER